MDSQKRARVEDLDQRRVNTRAPTYLLEDLGGCLGLDGLALALHGLAGLGASLQLLGALERRGVAEQRDHGTLLLEVEFCCKV